MYIRLQIHEAHKDIELMVRMKLVKSWIFQFMHGHLLSRSCMKEMIFSVKQYGKTF